MENINEANMPEWFYKIATYARDQTTSLTLHRPDALEKYGTGLIFSTFLWQSLNEAGVIKEGVDPTKQ